MSDNILTRRFATSGQQDDPLQLFYNNNFAIPQFPDIQPNVFSRPQFSSNTGTLEYYSQSEKSMFIIYARPFISMVFTANTFVFTGDSRFIRMINEVYKVPYDLMQSYNSNANNDSWQAIRKRIETPVVVYSTDTVFDYFNFYDNYFDAGAVGFTSLTDTHDFQVGEQIIIYQLGGFTNPQYEGLHTITSVPDQYAFVTSTPFGASTPPEGGRAARASSITAATINYDFFPNQLIKPAGSYSEEVFEDRAQYLFNTRYSFYSSGNSYNSCTVLDIDNNIVPFIYTSTTVLDTIGDRSIITQGPWSGLSANGLFFTCFQPASKPIVEFPFPDSGVTRQHSFTPTFNFSNVEDGDRYILQITYNMSDSGFTDGSSVSGYTTYTREKTTNSREEIVDKTSTVAVGTDSTTSKTTRRMNVPIKPGQPYWFRIGNIKLVKNIFAVEQKTVTYSDVFSSITGSRANIELFVDSASVSSVASASTSVNSNLYPTHSVTRR